jgi:alpha-acetolactate decarboxylase/formylmethanofuran dehydrogenase subunit E
MKKFSLFTLFLLFTISAFAQHGVVKSAGAMSETGKTGFAPTISLDSLKKYPRVFGLGPLGKMQGEITLVDGVPFAGKADLEGNASIQTAWDIEAPFFVYGEVAAWESFPLKGTVTDQSELEKIVETVALANGYDLAEPFAFRIAGTFDHMVTHIVTPRSADIVGFKEGRNQENYPHEKESGQLIGFYSQTGRRIYTHHDSNIHMHFINESETFTGHVDKIETSLNGLTLFLPSKNKPLTFKTNDTDFSKGKLSHFQEINLDDLVKFHGHLCDGLVVGAMGLQEAMEILSPNQAIDRTDFRIVSKSSPCLTDAAVYLTGARYQFGTFYISDDMDALYVVQKISDGTSYQVNLKDGVKPAVIKEMEKLAVMQELSPCQLQELRAIEDEFTDFLFQADAKEIFTIQQLSDFEWKPMLKNDFVKTDIINKNAASCIH